MAQELLPERVQAQIIVTYGDVRLQATLLVPLREQPAAGGALAQCPTVFHPTLPITVTTGEDPCCLGLDGEPFPAMTRYTVEGTGYLLYHPGCLQLPANSQVQLWIPPGEAAQSITLTAGETKYPLSRLPEPPAKPQGNTPLVVSQPYSLGVQGVWGEIQPQISVYRLETTRENAAWQPSTDVVVKPDSQGILEIDPAEAPAGTYRVCIQWKEDDVLLYEIAEIFFIQNAYRNQGGTGL